MSEASSSRKVSRRTLLRHVAGATAAAAFATTFASEADAISTSQLEPGDILLGRRDRNDRPFYGYWRHVAIWDGRRIIEGGMGMSRSRVSATDLRQFELRYGIIIVMRLKWSSRIYGPRMAAEAYQQLGGRTTCSGLITTVYNRAFGRRYVSWVKPDHVAGAVQLRATFSQHS